MIGYSVIQLVCQRPSFVTVVVMPAASSCRRKLAFMDHEPCRMFAADVLRFFLVLSSNVQYKKKTWANWSGGSPEEILDDFLMCDSNGSSNPSSCFFHPGLIGSTSSWLSSWLRGERRRSFWRSWSWGIRESPSRKYLQCVTPSRKLWYHAYHAIQVFFKFPFFF